VNLFSEGEMKCFKKSVFLVEKLNAINGLLEAFGRCRTVLNQNASRFATVVTLDFDHASQISAANVQGLLLECQRVVRRPEAESNFHAFYYLWEGCDEALRKELFLDTIDDPSAVISPLRRTAEKDTAKLGWSRLMASFDAIHVTAEEQKVVWSALAAIFHLAFAEATRGTASYKSQFLRATHAQRAAALLGVSPDELHSAVFRSKDEQRRNGLPQKPTSSNGR
jgi:myosin heavy subunit